jgi:hypothetical protein
MSDAAGADREEAFVASLSSREFKFEVQLYE